MPGGKRRRLAQHTSPPLSYEIRAIAQHAISLLLSDYIIVIILLYDVQEKFENNTILLKTLKKAVEDKTLEKVGGYGLQHIRSLYVPGVHMIESPAFELSQTAANGKCRSYKIPGETYAPPADETVTIKELETVFMCECACVEHEWV